jgi:hypothetical protein
MLTIMLLAGAVVMGEAPASRPASQPAFPEITHEMRVEPGVRIVINRPDDERFDRTRPTELILYALPNGNTIEWTIGRGEAPGRDWHFYIQHIGAQTRRLREAIRDRNIVVAYLEADGRSWPAWKGKREEYRTHIPRIVEAIERELPAGERTITLTGHSGGGSFVHGYIDSFETIPPRVTRISFLDSNYGFSTELAHGDKMLAWLRASERNVLSVICYDDREITVNGKKVVSPTGGTWRATHRLLDDWKGKVELRESTNGDVLRYRGLDGRIDLILHRNPENKILHTELVGGMSGYIHSMTVGSPYEDRVNVFGGEVTWRGLVEP